MHYVSVPNTRNKWTLMCKICDLSCVLIYVYDESAEHEVSRVPEGLSLVLEDNYTELLTYVKFAA